MSTHAVNRFEADAQRAVPDLHWELKPFTAIQGQGPAVMPQALFYNVLDTNPIEASLPEIKKALPEPVTESRAEDPASGRVRRRAGGHDHLAPRPPGSLGPAPGPRMPQRP